MTKKELNDAAMQIILHAGDCRNSVTEALELLENGKDSTAVDDKMKEAKEEITEAHKIQTEMIQHTIETDDFETTLLFSHAQDTLMTIYSELNMAKHIIKLYRNLEAKNK